MKISQYLFASLRRKIALYIGNQINQYTQQDCDFYHIINEKMDAAAKPAGYIKPHLFQTVSYQPVQPFHAEYLILNKIPYHRQSQPFSVQDRFSMNFLNSPNVSQFKK